MTAPVWQLFSVCLSWNGWTIQGRQEFEEMLFNKAGGCMEVLLPPFYCPLVTSVSG